MEGLPLDQNQREQKSVDKGVEKFVENFVKKWKKMENYSYFCAD